MARKTTLERRTFILHFNWKITVIPILNSIFSASYSVFRAKQFRSVIKNYKRQKNCEKTAGEGLPLYFTHSNLTDTQNLWPKGQEKRTKQASLCKIRRVINDVDTIKRQNTLKITIKRTSWTKKIEKFKIC
jgi:hypothetical protein